MWSVWRITTRPTCRAWWEPIRSWSRPLRWGWTFGGYTNAPDYTDPRSQQWNFQIERQLTATSMASIGYVGSHTQRLDWCCKANYPQGGPFCQNNPAQGFTCSTTPLTPAQIVAQGVPAVRRAGVELLGSVGFSTFHALEAQYQQPLSHGLETLVAWASGRSASRTPTATSARRMAPKATPSSIFLRPV